jgi:hypothetical protein
VLIQAKHPRCLLLWVGKLTRGHLRPTA